MIYTAAGVSLPQAYHAALVLLYEFGTWRANVDWQTNRLEVSMLIEVLSPRNEPAISKMGIYGPRDLKKYELELCDGIEDFEVEKGNWTYTYHSRFANQLPLVIEELRRNPGSTRAVLMIRDHTDILMEDGPCLESIQFTIRGGALDCFATFRSNDAIQASFINMWGITALQQRVADELRLPIGRYAHYAKSFHIYEKDFAFLENSVKRIQDARRTGTRDGLCYKYNSDWKEDMDESVDDILAEIEVLKNR